MKKIYISPIADIVIVDGKYDVLAGGDQVIVFSGQDPNEEGDNRKAKESVLFQSEIWDLEE